MVFQMAVRSGGDYSHMGGSEILLGEIFFTGQWEPEEE